MADRPRLVRYLLHSPVDPPDAIEVLAIVIGDLHALILLP